MALEKLGSGQNRGPENGPRFGHYFRSRKEAKEETITRLSLL